MIRKTIEKSSFDFEVQLLVNDDDDDDDDDTDDGVDDDLQRRILQHLLFETK